MTGEAQPSRRMGTMLGRQPDLILVTPSKALPWYYGIIVEGERFTTQQLAVLKRRSVNPATAEAMTVTRNATLKEWYWPAGSPAPVFQFECPVVHTHSDGRVLVIAPNGDEKLVYADGWPTPVPEKRRAR